MDIEGPKVNVTELSFPSDRVCFGFIRLSGNKQLTENVQGEYEAAIHIETMIAEKVFAKRIGKNDPHPDSPIAVLADGMQDFYQAFGIASGRHQAKQLLRAFIADVTAQADVAIGRSR